MLADGAVFARRLLERTHGKPARALRTYAALALITASLYTGAFVSQAFDPNYAPFPPGRQPKPFRLTPCKIWLNTTSDDQLVADRVIVWGMDSDTNRRRTHLRWIEDDDGKADLEVLAGDGRLLTPRQTVSDIGGWNAASADFNADGEEDFVVVASYRGCGSAAHNVLLVFAISHRGSYIVSTIATKYEPTMTLVDLDRDGRSELIHAALLWSDEADERDKKHHTYWVYHKLELKDACWVVATPGDDFPRWIWHTLKPNHKPTQRLTEQAKARIWQKAGGNSQIFWLPELVGPVR